MSERTGNSVCVVIAAYNAASTIGRAIQSALAEPRVAEVVVVDDASTDDTVAASRNFDDGTGRLKVLVQPENYGPSAARNRAIEESVSPWLCVLDADDFFLAGRMEALLAYSWKADLIADDMWQVPEHKISPLAYSAPMARRLSGAKSLLGRAYSKPHFVNFTEFVLSNVTKKGGKRRELGFIKPLMRREFLARYNIYYKEYMRLGEDFELYARMLAFGARLLIVPARGYVSVTRPNSLSGRHSENDLRKLRDCGRGIQRDANLSSMERTALYKHYLSVDCRLQWRLLISAVKGKDMKAALNTFLHPWPVPVYLAEQLLNQLYVRTLRRKEI